MGDLRYLETSFQLEHRHNDGSWSSLSEERTHHDAAEHDPERRWGIRRIFRCKSCGEEVAVVPGSEGGIQPGPDSVLGQ
jgi:hypothetical protein